ncbi:MAG: TIGR03749 family integrating conjugative element protein [Methylococcales bacterium]
MNSTKWPNIAFPALKGLLLSGLTLVPVAPAFAGDIPPGLGITADGTAEVSAALDKRAAPAKLVKAPINKALTETSPAVERILWDKTPIAIQLGVGNERMVSFPGTVRLGIPNSVTPLLRTQSQNGTVYWLASAPFEATRIQVQDVKSGQFYLVDLFATGSFNNNTRLEIINPTAEPVPSDLNTPAVPELLAVNPDINPAPVVQEPQPGRKKSSPAADYLTLTRYAAQQLYAPARLLKTPQGIQPAPFNTEASDNLVRGGELLAEPVAAWRKGTLYVTAVKLTNRSAQPITLDPRLIRGQWRTATFQHAHLGPKFRDDNVTALYLVSDRPFQEVY